MTGEGGRERGGPAVGLLYLMSLLALSLASSMRALFMSA